MFQLIQIIIKYKLKTFEELRYKPEGRGYDSRWCHWDFSLTVFWSHYGPGVDSVSNKNEYQEYFLAVKAADS
jgi:hypothetical protein